MVACLLAALSANGQGKAIRLRTGEILTPPRASQPPIAAAAIDRRPDGLFLIQFESSIEPEWRTRLRNLGVELIQYVPDDAFVARVRGTDLADLRALPFVRWLDRYRPEQKMHGRLLNTAGRAAPDAESEITALVDPRAGTGDLARLQALFRAPPTQSRHRFGTILRGRLPASRLIEAASSHAVLWMEPAPDPKLSDESASAIVGGPATNHLTFNQALGYDGSGVTVAVADSGLHNGTLSNHTELLERTRAVMFYEPLTDASDEHAHGTHVAGIIAGRGITQEGDDFGFFGLGVAPGARIVAQRIFDGQGQFQPPPSYAALAHDAVSAGAIIGNNSWGEDTQGRYDLSAMQFDDLVRDAETNAPGDQPYILVFAAGNAGPGAQTIASPAVGKNVIAVGATQGPRTNAVNYRDGPESLASFSSRGPCEDGRIKPDLVAPGTWIASLLSPLGSVENAWGPINNEFVFMGGTSQASPHVAAAAAVFVQYYRNNFSGATPSPALVKAALINAATGLDGPYAGAPVPNMDEGWGRANVAALVRPDRTFEFIDQDEPLAVNGTYERSILVNRSDVPLRIAMAYTDYPGYPAAIPALVNNLDLELIGPDGRSYRGNQFERGESLPGPGSRDAINNVECIHLANPARGEYTVRVLAQGIAQDSRDDTPTADQDFALVISGGIPARGEGVILTDRTAYRAPSQIAIKLLDADLAGSPSAIVTARSLTEQGGQPVTLSAAGADGVFVGTIATATGTPVNDGKLQVADGDWIRLEYFDASVPTTHVVTVEADLVPPSISSVEFTNAFGQRVVTWSTDEPSTSLIRYGTSPGSLTQAVTNNALTKSHAIELPGLVPDQTYYFAVVSTDAAGNTATDNNGGDLYTFIPRLNATVLLVDAYQADPQDPVIPLSAYTDPLTEIGVTFDVWSLAELQSLPEFNSMHPYPVVIWRINDSFRRPNDSIPAPQQEAIQQYLNAGGSFFLASMNVISRLLNQGAASFVTNVLHVQRFILSPTPFEHCTGCDEDVRVPVAVGVPGDPIGRGMAISFDYSGYSVDGLRGPDFSDTFTASTNASPFLLEAVSGKPCGVRFPRTGQDGAGRLVFASVPLDAIPASGFFPNTRADFLRRVMQFLAPGVGGVGTVALNQSSYTLPDLITIEMADSDLERVGAAAVSIRSDSSPPITMFLAETARPGLFRGVVPVADAAGASQPGVLKAAEGDRIEVEYLDASTALAVTTAATIDTIHPQVSEIAVKAGFFDALINWTTSEPTDALIQFGESSFLGRTRYRSELTTSHSLRLIGLVPGRTYYFKISVRDEAGNITFVQNGDQLQPFDTLPPLVPMFFDRVEGPETFTNWTVLSAEDSQREWSAGPPHDGHTTVAFSGANVWASNLYGDYADVIDTYLISPGIDLRGANVAELRFQHDFDFIHRTEFDVVNEGRLLISTNVLSEPVQLAEYRDYILDWRQEIFDLTPYAGRVVFLIWHHQLRSASPDPPIERPGWAIDDVRVTASNVPAGTIRVTNNLSQARFAVRRGGLVQPGQGASFLFTNLPPGTYTVTFEDVPFYTTPAPRTNALASNAQITVGGVYGFADLYTNGMSDAWEISRFGSVSPTRTRSTDTDDDGFPDYAEFVAGTNPLEPDSYLYLADPFPISRALVRFSWSSVPGRSYQLQGSGTAGSWIPLSNWIRASSDVTTVFLPPPGSTGAYLCRVEVRP